MEIELIKTLRAKTGAGMLECKKALRDALGNIEDAEKMLLTQLEQSAGNHRVPSKGLTRVAILNHQAILFEVNAETDFAHKHPLMIELMTWLSETLISSPVTNAKDALKVVRDDVSVEAKLTYVSARMKERLLLRRFYRLIKDESYTFGHYIHQGGKVSSLVILNQKDDLLAHDLAMQVAANAPLYLSLALIDEDTINYERMMFEKTHQSTDEKAFMADLKLRILDEQPMIKDQSYTVKDILKQKKISIIDFFRFEVGQGIENKLNCRLDLPCDGSSITVTPTH